MIRPFTCLCLVAACGSGLYLYSEKHRTALLDRTISHVIHETEATRAQTGLLRAEWALLNEPQRLQDMAEKYLTLKPMAPTQFVQLAGLSTHLPAPQATPPAGSTDDDAGNTAMTADIAATPAVVENLPATHPMVAAAPDPARKLASADARAHTPHHVALADRQDQAPHYGLQTRGTPLPLAAPQPMGASVYSALARPIPARRNVMVAALPSYASARSPVVSTLGGRTALPPPIPYDGQ